MLFANGRPSSQELLALRSLLPAIAQLPPAELKALLGSSGRHDLGDFPIIEARRIQAAASALGLRHEERDSSLTTYLAVDVTGSTEVPMVVEDEVDAQRVHQEMIAAGVPVTDDSEAC